MLFFKKVVSKRTDLFSVRVLAVCRKIVVNCVLQLSTMYSSQCCSVVQQRTYCMSEVSVKLHFIASRHRVVTMTPCYEHGVFNEDE